MRLMYRAKWLFFPPQWPIFRAVLGSQQNWVEKMAIFKFITGINKHALSFYYEPCAIWKCSKSDCTALTPSCSQWVKGKINRWLQDRVISIKTKVSRQCYSNTEDRLLEHAEGSGKLSGRCNACVGFWRMHRSFPGEWAAHGTLTDVWCRYEHSLPKLKAKGALTKSPCIYLLWIQEVLHILL